MKNFALVAGLVALIAAGAWAADMAVEKAPPATSIEESPNYDATVELRWDSGATSWLVAWYTGAGAWVAVDYDITTVKTYPHIASIKLYTYLTWPNSSWDGFRLGVYSFSGGVPGSLLWGPEFVMPTVGGWNTFSVDWTLPAGMKKFLPAMEQYYNYPNCDPHVVDNIPGNNGHSWLYYGGTWGQYSNSTPGGYYNLMIRVVMDNEHNPGVAPTSAGRIKALYY